MKYTNEFHFYCSKLHSRELSLYKIAQSRVTTLPLADRQQITVTLKKLTGSVFLRKTIGGNGAPI
jgi:hypothetical protein